MSKMLYTVALFQKPNGKYETEKFHTVYYGKSLSDVQKAQKRAEEVYFADHKQDTLVSYLVTEDKVDMLLARIENELRVLRQLAVDCQEQLHRVEGQPIFDDTWVSCQEAEKAQMYVVGRIVDRLFRATNEGKAVNREYYPDELALQCRDFFVKDVDNRKSYIKQRKLPDVMQVLNKYC